VITLRWSTTAGADIAYYRIYQSIIGFRSPFLAPAVLSGKTLQLKMNGSTSTQEVAFDGITNIVTLINQTITGGRAATSYDGSYFYFRSTEEADVASVEIVGGTALTLLGLIAKTITEKSEDFFVKQIADEGLEEVEWVDMDGTTADWYAISTMDSYGAESSKSGYTQAEETTDDTDGIAFNKKVRSSDLLVDADFVRDKFLFGVNLKDDEGNEMPDSMIEFYIRAAQDWLRNELQIILHPTTVEAESHDYHIQDFYSFGFVKLLNLPVRKVTSLRMKYPVSENSIEFDPKWYKVDARNGQINLVPTAGTISQILLGQGGSFLPILYTSTMWVPAIIEIDYTCGFEYGQVPYDILEVIGMKASLGPLNIAGDLIAGAGIATKSISLDGLSQSIGTTSSATNAGYGARIIQYSKQIDRAMTNLRLAYRGVQMTVV